VTPVRITVALCLGFIALVVGLFFYSMTREEVLSEDALRDLGVLILPTPRELPEFSLVTADGKPFTAHDLEGKWTFAFFGFTNCPDVCPTTMAVLAQAQQRLLEADPEAAESFQGVLVTVDPERDTPEKLGAYVHAFSPRFIGVTGDVQQIAGLAAGVNVAFAKVPLIGPNGSVDASSYTMDHTANIVIINPRGHYHGFIKYPQQADTIVEAYRSLAANF
jgi:protein SCO1/2